MEIFFLTTDNLPFSFWFVGESHTLKVKPFDRALWRKKMCDTFIKTLLNLYLNHLNTKKKGHWLKILWLESKKLPTFGR